jgi:hypothetical protein
MKKVLCLGLFLNAALVAGFLWKQAAAEGEGVGAGNAPVGNGDVNRDGRIEISDASSLLNFLFLGGPAPLPCPPSQVASGLPATGQTTCYSSTGIEVNCFSFSPATCPYSGQDGLTRTGCPDDASRFVVNADDTVTDNCTGLQWQRFTADRNGDFAITDGDEFAWCAAIDFCESSSFAGHGDWRLPNVRELESIVDYGESNPAADPVFRAEDGCYWTSTTLVSDPTKAFVVCFRDGIVGAADKIPGGIVPFSAYVRAVRGGR